MIKKTLYSIITFRILIWEMAKRDLKVLNKGAFLGYFWIIINPLIQTSVYVIVVSIIFKNRLSENSGIFDYSIYVLSGMIPWQIVIKSLQEAPLIIRTRIDLVKEVIYPIETLPISNLIFGSFGSCVSLIILIILCAISGNLKWSFILIPIPYFLLVLFILGISWIFSIIGVIIKDLREVVIVSLNLMVYISPVVVNKSIVGDKIWSIIMINPISHIIICFRDVFNSTFHFLSWIIFILLSISFFILGAWVMTKAKILINEYI